MVLSHSMGLAFSVRPAWFGTCKHLKSELCDSTKVKTILKLRAKVVHNGVTSAVKKTKQQADFVPNLVFQSIKVTPSEQFK